MGGWSDVQNDQRWARLALGKGPIDFINPTVRPFGITISSQIYSSDFAGAFNDITEGNNPGCNSARYDATVGWDPVTGRETPNFPVLLNLSLFVGVVLGPPYSNSMYWRET